VTDLLGMLTEMGLAVYATSDGWYYPRSNSAQSVADAFQAALTSAGVTLQTETQVTGIRVGKSTYRLSLQGPAGATTAEFAQVVVAAGGKAYPSLGSRGELFAALAGLGHTVLPVRPALAPVLAELGALSGLQGVRLDVGVSLYLGKRVLGRTQGNLIFTAFGLNGPAVMDLSHLVSAHPNERMVLSLDLLAFYRAEFDALLARKRTSSLPLGVFLEAFFPPKVAALYSRLAGLAADTPLAHLSVGDLAGLLARLSDTRLAVKGVRDFDYCQVSAGGVPVNEVDPLTLQSRRLAGLYLVGETLDVVGPCGGYNLQYAFSSGALAGRSVATG
jgi:predicted Rossmann fold flavoprotein